MARANVSLTAFILILTLSGLASATSGNITNPANGSATRGVMMNVTWDAFTFGAGSNVTYNISLYNATGTFNRTINGSTNLTSTLFNASGVAEGTWIIYAEGCDELANCSNSSSTFTLDNTPPLIAFNAQIPFDITTTSNINTLANITYNISDGLSGLNASSPRLFYWLNTSTGFASFVNGTGSGANYSSETGGNITSNMWEYNASENSLYAYSINIPGSYFSQQANSIFSETGSNTYAAIELLNISNLTSYDFFEVMVNGTTSGTARVYYCNSSYDFSHPLVSNANCAQIGSMASNQIYNHTHNQYNAHQVFPFSINTTTGKIALTSVRVTAKSYFMVRGASTGTTYAYYINNQSRTGASRTSTNNGIAWTNQTYTFNAHAHQYTGSDAFNYYACASDLAGNQNCSSVRYDILNLTGMPPTSPTVYSPANGTYRGNISINYTAAASPNGFQIILYNISLYHSNGTLSQAITANNSANLSYAFDSTGAQDGSYHIRVWACDDNNGCSFGDSEPFNLDATQPSIAINAPSANSITNSYLLPINVTASDTNLNYTNISVIGAISGTPANSTINQTNGTYTVQLNVPADGAYNITATAYDLAGNSNTTSSPNVTIDTTPPSITINAPENATYPSTSFSLSTTVAGPGIDSCWYSLDSWTTNVSFDCSTANITASVGSNTLLVGANDTLNNMRSSNVSFMVSLAPSLIRANQIPNDFTSTNLFTNTGFNITYNITSTGGVSNATLWILVNSTEQACREYNNGTPECGFEPIPLSSNTSSLSSFIDEGDTLYPHTENLEDRTFEQTAHSEFAMNTVLTQIRIEILNVTQNIRYNILEAMLNSSGTTAAEAYYCNSSYTAGRVAINQNCAIVGTLGGTGAFNHTHGNASHQVIPFTINETGHVAGSSVMVTPTSYFVIRPIATSGAGWKAHYIPNTTRTGAMRTTNDRGVTWTNFSGTFDAHLHQYGNDSNVIYYACANNTATGAGNCSSIYNETLAFDAMPPTPPSIYAPELRNYSGAIAIAYTASESPKFTPISYYNISLYNELGGFNKTIRSNNSLNLTYDWDSAGTADGTYRIGVEACDIDGLCSIGYSREFTTDNTAPNVAITAPANTTYNHTSMTLTTNITDANLDSCQYSLDNWATNVTFNCSTANITASEGANSIKVRANDTLGNLNASEAASFIVDTIAPGLNIASPANTTYNTSDIPLNFTATDDAGFSCTVMLNGIVNSSTCGNYSLTLSDGAYTLNVTANDTAGNPNSSAVSFVVDTIPPSVSINAPASGTSLTSRTITMNITATDANLNYTNISIYNSIGALITATTSNTNGTYLVQLDVPADGAYNITAASWDTAGNYNATGQVSVQVTQQTVVRTGGGGGCYYNWTCGNWTPSACPATGLQARTCKNTGTCSGTEGKPNETSACGYITPQQENRTNATIIGQDITDATNATVQPQGDQTTEGMQAVGPSKQQPKRPQATQPSASTANQDTRATWLPARAAALTMETLKMIASEARNNPLPSTGAALVLLAPVSLILLRKIKLNAKLASKKTNAGRRR